jgi:hypothetical protein
VWIGFAALRDCGRHTSIGTHTMTEWLTRLLCHDCHADISFLHGNAHHCLPDPGVWRRATRRQRIRFLCLDCLENRLGRPLSEADLLLTPAEMFAQFAGEPGRHLPAHDRQHQLDQWRTPAALTQEEFFLVAS